MSKELGAGGRFDIFLDSDFDQPSTMYRFPIRHQMKTVAQENT